MRFHTVRSMMVRLFCLFCLASIVLVIPSAGHAKVDKGQDSGSAKKSGKKDLKAKYKEGELLVRFKQSVSKEKKNAVHGKVKAKVLHSYRSIDGLEHVKIAEGKGLNATIAGYKSDPDVLYAEPNYYYQIQAMPDDPMFTSMWGLNNTGQDGGTADADINAPEAWDAVIGSPSTIVAVIDTGVDYNHPDLAGNMWTNPGEIPGNVADDDGNGYVDDVHGINAITGTGDPFDDEGHGTHVAGTIAASGNNGMGVTGVSWQSGIIACKFIASDGYGLTSDAVKCLDYLYQLRTRPDNPVNVILSNNSWGSFWKSQAVMDAINHHREAGILFVAAAGNSWANTDSIPFYPAGYDLPNIISVGATDHNDNRVWFSNYGKRSVDVFAPGTDILSTTPNNTYDSYSGTSMAAPHVSGLAALVHAQDPARDWKTVKNLIISGGQIKPGTSNLALSGRRIRAFDTSGTGSLSCVNQVVLGRLQPRDYMTVFDAGALVTLSALHINCGTPNGDVTVSVYGGPDITLKDDGQGADAEAGDGIYSAQWLPPAQGTYSVHFPGNDNAGVHVAKHYYPPIEYSLIDAIGMYRYGVAFQSIDFTEGEAALIATPFPLPFVDEQFPMSGLLVSPYGTLSFTENAAPAENTSLPAQGFETLVAPYWDDLIPSPIWNGGVFWGLSGEPPHREFVVEWRDMTTCSECLGTATFQVVFFEDKTDILFNYDSLYLDDGRDQGATATIGIQSDPFYCYINYSVDSPFVQSRSSLLWRTASVVATAGEDLVANAGDVVTLDGSSSFDYDKTITGYHWEQTAGAPVVLTGEGTAAPHFTAPNSSGTLSFKLTVTNDLNQTASDTVDVFVNLPPIANAGPDQFVETGSAVVLNGTGSSDPDGRISSYNWTQTSGTAVTLTGTKTANPSFTAPSVSGTLTFQLTVKDDDWGSATDTVNVSVNLTPSANAGADQLVQSGATVSLNGTASSDSDGTIASYNWVQTAGTTVTLTGPGTATPSFTAPAVSGTLTFQLAVTDNNGATATDTVNVSVNLPPSANAGSDQVVQAGAAVSLNGSGSSDSDGTIAYYNWIQTAGTTVTLTGAGTATPSFTAPAVSETLTFQLTVTDNNGAAGTDTVNVSVNLPPSANAGPDQQVQSGASVSLNGAGSSDPDGAISSYNWVQTAGTTVTLTGAGTASPSFTAPSVSGTLTFELTVTDNSGVAGTDTVNVSVNLPPSANAGPDQQVQSGASASLNGTGSSDSDGTIAFYNWVQTAGTTVALFGANTASPSFTAPSVSGTLTFELTVTDNNGAAATDTVNVRVNMPPSANAGADQLVQSGATVSLNGAASSDSDGTIASYNWVQTAGTTVTLTGPGTATPSFTAPTVSGTLTFQLTVTDNNGATATDTVNVSVNLPPSANAGPDQTVKTRSIVTLSGTGSADPDGTIASYAWVQTAGTGVTLSDANSSAPVFTAPGASETLSFRLTVTDNRGASASDTVNIFVSKTGR